jgi:glutathionyl-hydroquinone reductase
MVSDTLVIHPIILLPLPCFRKFSTNEECPGAIPDTVNNASYIRDLYFKANPDYEGRFTVPVLWDKKLKTIGKR